MIIRSIAFALVMASAVQAQAPAPAPEYRLLATTKTSTMEKELNEAATAGFRFESVMGGQSAFGGAQVVTVMSKPRDSAPTARFKYRLLATNKTSTMQKEMQEAGDSGYEYRGQTIFNSTFGGEEVVVILERDTTASILRYEYKLLATNKTSTMEKELQESSAAGFQFVGLTVAKTAAGGKEVVTILRRRTT